MKPQHPWENSNDNEMLAPQMEDSSATQPPEQLNPALPAYMQPSYNNKVIPEPNAEIAMTRTFSIFKPRHFLQQSDKESVSSIRTRLKNKVNKKIETHSMDPAGTVVVAN